jgi:hypothetical protein
MEPMRKGERRETSERWVPYISIVNGDWQRRGLSHVDEERKVVF